MSTDTEGQFFYTLPSTPASIHEQKRKPACGYKKYVGVME